MIKNSISKSSHFSVLILMNFMFLNTLSAQSLNANFHGLKPLTPDEKIKLENRKIKKVNPNNLAIKRINKLRESKGLKPLPLDSVPVNEVELEGSLSSAVTSTSTSSSTISSAVPAQVDNSNLLAFPPIGNQASEGSCVAWAVTYYQMSHEVCLSLGCDNKNARAKVFSPRWTYNMINFGTDGGSYFSDAYSMNQNHGSPLLSELPYAAGNYRMWDLNPDHWESAINSRMSQMSSLLINTDAGMANVKQMLLNGHVLVVGTYITSWVINTVKSNPDAVENPFVGQAIASYLNGTVGGHGMTIVGYDDNIWNDINSNGLVDAGELGAFKVANSWGAGWRNAGFIWASYDAFRSVSQVAGFAPSPRYQLTQNGYVYSMTYSPYTPKLLAKVTASHLSRNQMNLQFGTSSTSVLSPQSMYYPFALSNKGGSYAFDGSATEIEGTFYFDVSNLLSAGVDQQLFYLNASDNLSGNGLTIKSFEIIDPVSRLAIYSSANLPQVIDASSKQFILGNYTVDTIAPSAPSNLIGSIVSRKRGKTTVKSISLNWTSSSDNVGVAKYYIYRNNIKIGESSSLTYNDQSAQAGIKYNYSVSAVDAQLNQSAISNIINIGF